MIYAKKEFKVHFIGVGGVSMSGLAEYFLSVGFTVSGSDREDSYRIKKLISLGAKIQIGHNVDLVKTAQAVVYNDAISVENPELKYAKENGIYILSRAEALKMVCENFCDVVGVAGCHGKTTATCMIAHIFNAKNLKFTAHIGGEDLKLGNCVIRGNDVFLSEVCEFKKNIDKFSPDFAVCLNVGVDHMDCYKTQSELFNSYISFVKRGYKSIISQDDAILSTYNHNNGLTFSSKKEAFVQAKNIRQNRGKYSFDLFVKGKKKGKIRLSVFGRHNVDNALAASTLAISMGIEFKYIKRGLKNFVGVVRRFESLGQLGKGQVICDYAHHPTEILASIKTAKEWAKGKVFVLFQPHTYSRTVFLKEEFISVLKDIENLGLYKTFSARENYIEGGSAYDLCQNLVGCEYFEDVEKALVYYKERLGKNDILLVLGAGDLYYMIKDKIGQ